MVTVRGCHGLAEKCMGAFLWCEAILCRTIWTWSWQSSVATSRVPLGCPKLAFSLMGMPFLSPSPGLGLVMRTWGFTWRICGQGRRLRKTQKWRGASSDQFARSCEWRWEICEGGHESRWGHSPLGLLYWFSGDRNSRSGCKSTLSGCRILFMHWCGRGLVCCNLSMRNLSYWPLWQNASYVSSISPHNKLNWRWVCYISCFLWSYELAFIDFP